MFKRDMVFEMGDKVEELLTKDFAGYAQGLICDNKDKVIDMHIFKKNREYCMQYVFKENVDAEVYYNTFMHDLENNNLKEIELHSEERYLIDILIDNRIDLCTYSDHIFSFKTIYDEDAVDFENITSLSYDKETKIMKVHMNLDNVDIIIDFGNEQLRYLVEDKELDYEDYLDYLDMQYDREKRIKETKTDEEYVEEYETTDLVKFLDWMEEFNKQEENEYKLIIKNKNITQIERNEEYEFCAIDDIVKYWKIVKADGSIELVIEFVYEGHEEVWNISKDFGFEM